MKKDKCIRWRTQPIACFDAVQPLPAAPGDALLPAALQPGASPKSVSCKASNYAVRKDTGRICKICAVRKNTHAKTCKQCGQKRHTQSFKSCAVRQDTHTAWNYCGQKRHTSEASNFVRSEKTHMQNDTTAAAKPRLLWSHMLALTTGRHVTTQNQKKLSSSPSHILCNSSGVFPKVKSNWVASSSLISAKAAASNFSCRIRSILSSSSLTQSP